jgi:rare lipoprotein A
MHLQISLSNIVLAALLFALALSGCNSEPIDSQKAAENQNAGSETTHKQIGEASWYGKELQGQQTSSGEKFDQNAMTAAHPSLPMGTKAEVTNLENGKKVDVTINDRGPVAKGRAIDISGGAAKKLDMKKNGTAKVKIVTKKVKKKSHKHKLANGAPEFDSYAYKLLNSLNTNSVCATTSVKIA